MVRTPSTTPPPAQSSRARASSSSGRRTHVASSRLQRSRPERRVYTGPVVEQLGVGVIGLGWVAGEHVKAYQHEPRTKVVAVAGRDPAKTRARADELGLDARVHDGWEQLLRDPA